MKKPIFLVSLFLISGFLLYFLMKGSGGDIIVDTSITKEDSVLLAMVERVKKTDWLDTKEYSTIKQEIGLSESNENITTDQKEKMLGTLDINYAFSLSKKYDRIKFSFNKFPSELFNEMLTFKSKNTDLPKGISELKALRKLQEMNKQVDKFLEGKFDLLIFGVLKNQINEIALGDLDRNNMCQVLKSKGLGDLDKFKEAVEEVTKMINSAINDPDKRNNYKNLADFLQDEDVQKFTWYRNWFKDPENIRKYNIYEL
jgi:hypothetical protein